MLCYDRTKCAVDGFGMARLTQRQLGFVDPATAAQAIQGSKSFVDSLRNFFGELFGKSPDKIQFDQVRQEVWDKFAKIVDEVDAIEGTGELTRPLLQSYMDALANMTQQYRDYYNRVRAAVTPAWGDSRFNDFYEPMVDKYDEWKGQLQALPVGGFLSTVGGALPQGSGMMLGLLALLVVPKLLRGSR